MNEPTQAASAASPRHHTSPTQPKATQALHAALLRAVDAVPEAHCAPVREALAIYLELIHNAEHKEKRQNLAVARAFGHMTAKCKEADRFGPDLLSTGEALTAALVLNRHAWLLDMGYTIAGALHRIGPNWAQLVPAVAEACQQPEDVA